MPSRKQTGKRPPAATPSRQDLNVGGSRPVGLDAAEAWSDAWEAEDRYVEFSVQREFVGEPSAARVRLDVNRGELRRVFAAELYARLPRTIEFHDFTTAIARAKESIARGSVESPDDKSVVKIEGQRLDTIRELSFRAVNAAFESDLVHRRLCESFDALIDEVVASLVEQFAGGFVIGNELHDFDASYRALTKSLREKESVRAKTNTSALSSRGRPRGIGAKAMTRIGPAQVLRDFEAFRSDIPHLERCATLAESYAKALGESVDSETVASQVKAARAERNRQIARR